VTFTNESTERLRLNAMYLDAGQILLKFQRADGVAVPTGPPPVPEVDDGKAGRIDLEPGKSVKFTYPGGVVLGTPLLRGTYEVRFRYENDPPRPGEWGGTIELGPAKFEVTGASKGQGGVR